MVILRRIHYHLTQIIYIESAHSMASLIGFSLPIKIASKIQYSSWDKGAISLSLLAISFRCLSRSLSDRFLRTSRKYFTLCPLWSQRQHIRPTRKPQRNKTKLLGHLQQIPLSPVHLSFDSTNGWSSFCLSKVIRSASLYIFAKIAKSNALANIPITA